MGQAPSRMSVTNLSTGERLEAQYNPTGVEVSLEAVYNRVRAPGASREEMQYAGTGNTKIPIEMSWDGRSESARDHDFVQGFLLALMYPPQDPLSAAAGAPPAVLFRWPGWISLVMKVPKVSIKAERFSPDGVPTYYRTKLDLEDFGQARLGFEGIRRTVLRRAA